MTEISCGRPTCKCTLASASPEPFCCTRCAEQVKEAGRCDCGHIACGGLPATDEGTPIREKLVTEPALNRTA